MPYDRENVRGGFFRTMPKSSLTPLKIPVDEELRRSIARILRRRAGERR